ncbi:MAG TPA: PEGA domain-containing protein [Thermoanaerobaculia bacterium]
MTATGCLHVRPQEVRIETEPAGATAIAPSGDRCTTPCALRLPRIESQYVRLEKPGYESVDAELTGRTWRTGATASAAGDVLGGLGGMVVASALVGVLGIDVDFATGLFVVALPGFYGGMAYVGKHNDAVGADVKLEPNPLHVVLKPEDAPALSETGLRERRE